MFLYAIARRPWRDNSLILCKVDLSGTIDTADVAISCRYEICRPISSVWICPNDPSVLYQSTTVLEYPDIQPKNIRKIQRRIEDETVNVQPSIFTNRIPIQPPSIAGIVKTVAEFYCNDYGARDACFCVENEDERAATRVQSRAEGTADSGREKPDKDRCRSSLPHGGMLRWNLGLASRKTGVTRLPSLGGDRRHESSAGPRC